MLGENIIADLESKGFKRWQKGTFDRLYVNASVLGLECTYYKTGNISSATFNGEHISNSEGYRLKAAKTYVDINKGTIVSDSPMLASEVAKIMGIEYRYGDKIIKI